MDRVARRKQLGAFYTPDPIAAKLVEWCIRSPDDVVMDPSFGGCVFLKLAEERLRSLSGGGVGKHHGLVVGIDRDERAVASARANPDLDAATLIESDFFSVEPMGMPRFSANIGNPPYVRYQSWDAEGSAAHAISAGMGVKLSKLASIWAPFILHGCRFLATGGRLGQVVPAELLQAQYAKPVIEYLERAFSAVTVVMFEARVFPGALEEVLLLFADGFGEGPANGVGVVMCRDINALDLADINGVGRGFLQSRSPLLSVLPQQARQMYTTLANASAVGTLRDVAEVDIGAVTGANDFFIRRRHEVQERGFAPQLFRTVVSKAQDVVGATLRRDDIERLVREGRRTELLLTDGHPADRVETIRELISQGEQLGLPSRYKCRIRSPWWAVPLPKRGAPDAFLTYMSDGYPRMVLNEARVLSTNTIHNVLLRQDQSAAALSVGFYNSLTLLSAEVVGRSYGGGILKLEPTEAERLLVPRELDPLLEAYLPEVDRRLREGDIDGVLRIVDPIALKRLSLTEGELGELRSARAALRSRRRARSKGVT